MALVEGRRGDTHRLRLLRLASPQNIHASNRWDQFAVRVVYTTRIRLSDNIDSSDACEIQREHNLQHPDGVEGY